MIANFDSWYWCYITRGSLTVTGATTLDDKLTVNSNADISENLNVFGNLNVTGNINQINSDQINVLDKNIVLASNNNNDSYINGAGLILKSSSDKNLYGILQPVGLQPKKLL